jgi:hypothetical protein
MKRNISIIICILFLFTFVGCGDTKVINGFEYEIKRKISILNTE